MNFPRPLSRSALNSTTYDMLPTRALSVLFCALVSTAALQTASDSAKTDVFPQKDRIKSLPGLLEGGKFIEMYSGYLSVNSSEGCQASATRHLHYWMIPSEGDPSTDPVVLWLNGGPGASSVWGALAENGPYHTSDASFTHNTTSIPAVFYNELGWQKAASIIFLEAPGGVGFSYCDGTKGPVASCPTWNDTATAQDSRAALDKFFAMYSILQTQEFYVMGESYAGVYIPMLAAEILDHGSASLKSHFKGIMVGNGCMGFESKDGCCGFNSDVVALKYQKGHGLVSDRMVKRLQSECPEALYNSTINRGVGTIWSTSDKCNSLYDEWQAAMGGVNVYSIYDTCYLTNDNIKMLRQSPAARMAGPGGAGSYECGSETAMKVWLNRAEVKAAMNVKQIPWADHDGWSQYVMTAKDVTPIYNRLSSEIRVQIYFGDLDSGVPYPCAESWTSSQAFPVVQEWRPWTTDGATAMGGYVTTYKAAEDRNLTFVTIRGSGHMVPQFKPAAALELLMRYLRHEPLRAYNGSALAPPH